MKIILEKLRRKISIRELKKFNQVIALGGGAFMNFSIRKEVKKFSNKLLVRSKFKISLPRLKNIKKRPLLNKENLEGRN